MLRSVYCVLLISLAGCSFTNPFVKETFVEIPVPTSCITWEPAREPSSFTVLGADAPLWSQVKALLIDRENDQHFIEGQQAVINGCKD